jgi:hypothetical protein
MQNATFETGLSSIPNSNSNTNPKGLLIIYYIEGPEEKLGGGAFEKIDCGRGHLKMANRKRGGGGCEKRFRLAVIYNDADHF